MKAIKSIQRAGAIRSTPRCATTAFTTSTHALRRSATDLLPATLVWARGALLPLTRKYPAVCLLPGTELSFADEVRRESSLSPWSENIKYKTAIFRQVNQHNPRTHHDALEFPDGEIVLLTLLKPDQQATVLQLPASTSGSNSAQRAEEPAMAR